MPLPDLADLTVRTHESATPLAGNATKNGAVYDLGAEANPVVTGTPPGTAAQGGWSRFRALAAADVAGTLNVEQSPDGTAWFLTATASIAADFTHAVTLEALPVLRYMRAQVVNGVADQADFEFDTAVVAI